MAKAKVKQLYFAYGSNMNLNQMKKRCPKAKVVSAVTLPDYALAFNGKTSGWGVATIKPEKKSVVNGLLWEITAVCEKSLDIYEGYPTLYGKHTVTIYDAEGNPYEAMVYIMTAEHNAVAWPSQQYVNGIYDGYVQNGIPADTLKTAVADTYAKLTGKKVKKSEKVGAAV